MICWLFLCMHKVFMHMHKHTRIRSVRHICIWFLFTPGTPPKEANLFHTNRLPFSTDMHIIHTHFLAFFPWHLFATLLLSLSSSPPWSLLLSSPLLLGLYFFIHLIYSVWSCFILLEYYENLYYPQYECNVPLLDQAAITATSSLRERGPENARLNGKNFEWIFKTWISNV